MKELIPMNEYGLFADMKDTARVDSRYVAEVFGKNHNHVLRDIRNLLAPESGLSEEFRRSNFGQISYTDSMNRKQAAYAMTRAGFTMLVMGFTGKKALHFKELYIKRFDEMDKMIAKLVHLRDDFSELTDALKQLHPDAKSYDYSNECDMINYIVLGKSTQQFRKEHDIEKGKSIRPYLTDHQLAMLDHLQDFDTVLMQVVPDFKQRKKLLTDEFHKKELKQ